MVPRDEKRRRENPVRFDRFSEVRIPPPPEWRSTSPSPHDGFGRATALVRRARVSTATTAAAARPTRNRVRTRGRFQVARGRELLHARSTPNTSPFDAAGPSSAVSPAKVPYQRPSGSRDTTAITGLSWAGSMPGRRRSSQTRCAGAAASAAGKVCRAAPRPGTPSTGRTTAAWATSPELPHACGTTSTVVGARDESAARTPRGVRCATPTVRTVERRAAAHAKKPRPRGLGFGELLRLDSNQQPFG